MSYIRCLSNPEGLYIYATGQEKVCIHHNVSKPLSSGLDGDHGEMFTVPLLHFTRAIKAWKDGKDYYCKSGFLVAEEFIYLDDGMLVPERDITAMINDKRPTGYRVRLQNKSSFVYLWRTTWMYVVNNR